MDAELSLFMTNIAKVTKNSFVFDPFVGTGSMLLVSYSLTCLIWRSGEMNF